MIQKEILDAEHQASVKSGTYFCICQKRPVTRQKRPKRPQRMRQKRPINDTKRDCRCRASSICKKQYLQVFAKKDPERDKRDPKREQQISQKRLISKAQETEDAHEMV